MSFQKDSRFMNSTTKGFTLVELMVVVVIIVTLAALSMLGMSRMRGMADKASAVRSLSQLQLANVSYAGDNNGRYVEYLINDDGGSRIGFWYQVPEFLDYFRGEVLDKSGNPSKGVPLSMLDPKVVREKLSFYNSMAGNFGLNVTGLPATGGVANARPSFTMSAVTRPEQSMAFASATDVRVAYNARKTWFTRAPNAREGKTSDGGLAYRHGNKAIVVYYDGHVSELSKGDIEEIDKTKGGSKSAFWSPIQ